MATPGSFTAGQVLTAAEMNALPGGVIGSAKKTSNVTIDTILTDILTVTFDAVAGRLYKAHVTWVLGTPSTSLEIRSRISLDGSVINLGYQEIPSTHTFSTFSYFALFTASAGSRTVALAAQTNTGTIPANGAGTYGSILVVEDIGLP